jgi:hypothetical protein
LISSEIDITSSNIVLSPKPSNSWIYSDLLMFAEVITPGRVTMSKSIPFVIVFLLTHFPTVGQEKPGIRFEKTLNTIRSSRVTEDWDSLRKMAQDIKEALPESSYEYSKLVYEICSRINSAPMKNKKHMAFVQSLAISTVNSKKGPVDLSVRIAGFIQIDFGHAESDFGTNGWAESRRKAMGTILGAYSRLEKEVDRKFDFKDTPYVNIAPPGGKYPSGISPTAIEEPEIRKLYELALEANSNKIKEHNRQRDLHELEIQYLRNIEINTVRAYSIEPMNIQEVKADFTEHGIPRDLTNRIVQKLEERAMVLSKRPPPPKAVITPPKDPPGPDAHHADPRLRKRVTIRLPLPKVDAALKELGETTGVRFTFSGIQNVQPAVNGISVNGVPAWQVMDDFAADKKVDGRWEKDGDGYRLVPRGEPLPSPPPVVSADAEANTLSWTIVAIIAIPIILLASGGVSLWLWRRKSSRGT